MLISKTARALPVALAVGLLTAGCAGGAVPPTPAPISSEPIVDEEAALMPVGPLAMPAAGYWALGSSAGTTSTVVAGGCSEDANCPAFAVVSGADAQVAEQAVLDDGIGCPGGAELTPDAATLVSEDPASVAGEPGTLRVFDVDCVDGDGTVQLTVEQRQWSVDGRDGKNMVIVADRWTFAGLGDRIAAAQWRTADGS